MNQVLDFLKNNTFYIATVENDQPRVRPFGAVCEYNNKLYIVTNNTKNVFDQMLKNPKIEICSMDKEGRWLRVTAEVVTDENKSAIEKMLSDNPMLREMYSVDDGIIAVLYLKNVKAKIYTFSGESDLIEF